MRERRRQRRERKKTERQQRRAIRRAKARRRPSRQRINSAVGKATLTAALTLSAGRPGAPEPYARRAGSGALEAAHVLPELRQADDGPPTLVLTPPRPSRLLSRNSRFDAHIEAAARKHGVAVDLVRAIVQIESGFEPRAVSSKGAKGLMQLMPGTARQMGARRVLDPRQNVFAGARYLRYLLDMFDGNLTLAAAAYNAGLANVQRYGGVPPFPETRDYVEKVHALLGLEPPDLAARPTVAEALVTEPGGLDLDAWLAPEDPRGPFRSR